MTWLPALGPAIEDRRGDLHVPVFLGAAMQWNLRQIGDTRDVVLPVPDEAPLRVPAGFAEDHARFDRGLQTLAQGLQEQMTPEQIERALFRIGGVAERDAAAMADTFERLRELYRSGRNGIWPFILRNLMRPLWLSRPEQQADVLVDNPPWIAYRHLSPEMKPRLRAACLQMSLWVGGVLARCTVSRRSYSGMGSSQTRLSKSRRSRQPRGCIGIVRRSTSPLFRIPVK